MVRRTWSGRSLRTLIIFLGRNPGNDGYAANAINFVKRPAISIYPSYLLEVSQTWRREELEMA